MSCAARPFQDGWEWFISSQISTEIGNKWQVKNGMGMYVIARLNGRVLVAEGDDCEVFSLPKASAQHGPSRGRNKGLS